MLSSVISRCDFDEKCNCSDADTDRIQGENISRNAQRNDAWIGATRKYCFEPFGKHSLISCVHFHLNKLFEAKLASISYRRVQNGDEGRIFRNDVGCVNRDRWFLEFYFNFVLGSICFKLLTNLNDVVEIFACFVIVVSHFYISCIFRSYCNEILVKSGPFESSICYLRLLALVDL